MWTYMCIMALSKWKESPMLSLLYLGEPSSLVNPAHRVLSKFSFELDFRKNGSFKTSP